MLYKGAVVLITYLFASSVVTNLRYLTEHIGIQFNTYLLKPNQVILNRKITRNIEFKYKQLNLAYVHSSDIQSVFHNPSPNLSFLLPKY